MTDKITIKTASKPNLTLIERSREQHARYLLQKLPKPLVLLKSQVSEWAQLTIARVWSKADDVLLDHASRALSQDTQDAYYYALRELRHQQTTFSEHFIQAVELQFATCVEPLAADANELELSVINNDDMDELLALEGVAKKLSTLNKKSLGALEQRFDALSQLIEACELPLAPRALCDHFKSTLACATLEPAPRLVLWRVFDAELSAALPELYQNANQMLAQQGILPNLSDADKASSEKHAQRLLKEDDAGLMGEPVTLDETESLDSAGALHESTEQQKTTACDELTQAIADTEKMLHSAASEPLTSDDQRVLADIQQQLQALQAQVLAGGGQPNSSLQQQQLISALDGLATSLSPTAFARPGALLDALTAVGAPLPQGSPARQTLQVMDGVFGNLLQEGQFAHPLKHLFGRLQVPFAKAALVDKEKLFHPDHSARKLINAMADAGAAWGSSDALDENADPLYRKMHDIVERAVATHNGEPLDFQSLLDEFNDYTARDKKRLELLEKRIIDAEEGRAKAEKARLHVADAIADICAGHNLRHEVNHFIHKAWHQVMFVVCLKYSDDSELWREAVCLLGLVVDSSEARDLLACEQVKQSFARAHERFEALFEQTGFDSFEAERQLQQLKTFFNGLKPSAEPKAVAEVHSPAPQKQVELEKPAIDDKYFSQAKALTRGTWVDYQESGRAMLRCRLAAVIESTSRYIFVNRAGQKVMEMSLLAVAVAIKNGELVAVDNNSVFDRALEKVILSLRRSETSES